MADEPIAPEDDLSGADPSEAAENAANAALNDAKSRSTYRTLATVCAIAVIVLLGVLLFCLVRAAAFELSRVNNAVVALVASLVVAITVLAIALLRATFASNLKEDKGAELSLPNLELFKALRDAFDMVIKGRNS